MNAKLHAVIWIQFEQRMCQLKNIDFCHIIQTYKN